MIFIVLYFVLNILFTWAHFKQSGKPICLEDWLFLILGPLLALPAIFLMMLIECFQIIFSGDGWE